jgi:hypothetical protein
VLKPVRRNEYIVLELSGLRATPDSSRTRAPSVYAKSQNSVYLGD